MTVGSAEGMQPATPIESEAIDMGVKGDMPPLADDVTKEEGIVMNPPHKKCREGGRAKKHHEICSN
jgi:hypothetical protein